jgi:formylmethanofuran dehydrogenase subunit E
MFMPIEDVDDEEERSMTRMEKQERANRELAEAREKVKKTVQKWQKFFADHEKYFEVGKVAPEDLRKQKKGHLKPLCDDAKKMRPKRSTLKKRARDQEERLARERGSA